ncbi:MAG: hypothetical protein J5601_04840, partial [Elusimicrobiaceae bacterium]|nr:hypothetical protein [Elusimicrobiaceae bacterium]
METSNNLNNTTAKRYVNIVASKTLHGIARVLASLEAVSNIYYFDDDCAEHSDYRYNRIDTCCDNLRAILDNSPEKNAEFCADGGIMRIYEAHTG